MPSSASRGPAGRAASIHASSENGKSSGHSPRSAAPGSALRARMSSSHTSRAAARAALRCFHTLWPRRPRWRGRPPQNHGHQWRHVHTVSRSPHRGGRSCGSDGRRGRRAALRARQLEGVHRPIASARFRWSGVVPRASVGGRPPEHRWPVGTLSHSVAPTPSRTSPQAASARWTLAPTRAPAGRVASGPHACSPPVSRVRARARRCQAACRQPMSDDRPRPR